METRQSTKQGNLSGKNEGERQNKRKKGGNHLENKTFMTVEEVAKEHCAVIHKDSDRNRPL